MMFNNLPLTYTHPTIFVLDGGLFLSLRKRRERKRIRKKAAITVEASLAVPLFFFAVVSLWFLFEILGIQIAVRSGLQYAGKELAVTAYSGKLISTSKVKESVVTAIGSGRLNRSVVVGGASGLDTSESRLSLSGVAVLKAKYKVKLPIPFFRIATLAYEDSIRVKGWTGYERTSNVSDETVVYITDTGVVYHKNYHCTYLDLTVQGIPVSSVSSKRNGSGAKYYPCEYCGGKGGGMCYVTSFGTRYHSSVSCSELKRTVYAVPISEAVGKRPCSKCGGS